MSAFRDSVSEAERLFGNNHLIEPFLRGPYSHKDTHSVVLALSADMASLADLCERLLTAQVPEGQFRYEPLIPSVFVTWTRTNTHSRHEMDRQMGWTREYTMSCWVLTRVLKPFRNETYVYSHLAWFIPYTFVGDSYCLLDDHAIYNTREMQAFFTPADVNVKKPDFSMDVLALPQFDADTVVTRQTLFSIKPIDAQTVESPTMWQTWEQAVMGIFDALVQSPHGDDIRAGLDQAINPLAILSRTHQQIAYNRRYEIADNTESYLAVGEATMQLTAFREGGLLTGGYDIKLETKESQPLTMMLGLLGEEQPAFLAGWWLKFDFEVNDKRARHEIQPNIPRQAVLKRGRSFGFPMLRAPYYHRDGKISNFILEADIEPLTQLCDDLLNANADDGYLYRPLPYVVLRLAHDHLGSRNKDDAQMGWLPEKSASFWMLIEICHEGDAGFDSVELAWFIPYVLFDNHYSMVSDREVYSLYESLARFRDHKADETLANLSIEALGLSTFSQKSQAVWHQLLMIALQADETQATSDAWQTWDKASVTLAEMWAKLLKDQAAAERMVSFLKAPQPLLFVREYTDIADPNRARCRCVAEARLMIMEIRSGGLLTNAHDIVLNALDSHPIARMLGLPNGKQRVVGGWWTDVDFALSSSYDVSQAKFTPKKLAVLGGGIGALTTIYELTNQPGWQERYDITVYQEGWRLGGKLASGRNPERADRIEEDTVLHAFFGYYDNSFRLIRDVYDNFDKFRKENPTFMADFLFKSWRDAFHNQDFFVVMEDDKDTWSPWQIHLPPNDKVPGFEYPNETLWDYFDHVIELINANIGTLLNGIEGYMSQNAPIINNVLAFVKNVLGENTFDLLDMKTLASLDELMDEVDAYADNMNRDSDVHFDHEHTFLCRTLSKILGLMRRVERFVRTPDRGLRRLWLLMEIGLINLIGILEDDVFQHGFASINHLDYREWLALHGANEKVLTSAPIRAIYTIYEAYPGGVTAGKQAGDIAAGTAVHAILMLAFGYNGSAVWVPKTCMGEVVVAPLYQVLAWRGVKFEFFHKVLSLKPSKDGKTINHIVINRQATVDPSLKSSSYHPCREVKRLLVWPNEPHYEQLLEGEQLKAAGVDLESFWTDWPGVENISLQQGKDFDIVLMNISLAALKTVCEPLLNRETNPNSWLRWLKMVQEVKTVQTQGAKFWFEPRIGSMGWPMAPVASGAYVDPLNSSLDMSYSSSLENWPTVYKPDAVLAFVGPLADALHVPEPPDPEYPRQEKERVRQTALAWAERYIGIYCPYFINAEGHLDYDKLADLENGKGLARFEAQYWAANINPTNRAVLSVKGSDRYRMRTDETGFSNLFVVGDWVDNGYLNLGSVEAAVVSGLQATKAISGYAPKILKLLKH